VLNQDKKLGATILAPLLRDHIGVWLFLFTGNHVVYKNVVYSVQSSSDGGGSAPHAAVFGIYGDVEQSKLSKLVFDIRRSLSSTKSQ